MQGEPALASQEKVSQSALDRLAEGLADDMAAVNATIVARMASPVALIPQLASYIVAAGGKRIRPLLTLAGARICGYEGDRHIGLATAVEFIHTATLLHDDVVDESDLRRGQASANAVWGNQPSVLVGDFLFARAFQLMTDDGSLEVLRTLSEASAVIAEGEVLQLAAAHDLETDEALYLRVIGAKTAALFAAAARIGGVVAERPEAAEALAEYGDALGVAFQLVDDVLDYSAAQARLGKTIGDDFHEGKITLPVILAYAAGDAEDRAFWTNAMAAEARPGPEALARAQALIARHGALDACMARARAHGDRARAALSRLPAHPMREALADLVSFTIERDY